MKAEVGKISGVTAVDVDLVTGKVTVTANEPVGEALVRDAVEEAGYELTSA
ncbi:heavy metal-associated domain-containing protein [Nonomuraea sp. NPDC050643]|uniref:heavy-metal-associated domain-containing protein n=1 Tax=Nonomuraea sp. NPDC050643 TaxID=3155660 RepID=UPI0033CBB6C7